ncbi:MAG: cadherin [Gammaproteobacteria bacterium]|nr:cadherin [Gammaproteobacteria bacterium]MBU1725614.1 cadherin [Gammaproteobacteria bacterium]MBU2004034.1 cadherin [Gammaproteobacteria bacterium]
MKTKTSIQLGMMATMMAMTSPVLANVQFRIAYEAASNEYVVYMKPDSTPSPDMALSAQVTLVAPHATGAAHFGVGSIQSSVQGINWANHSRVDAPAENPAADYLSFGLFYTGGRPPAFGWAAGREKRIFSFKSPSGCIPGVALLGNSDPFSQLPNSVGTNPGNEFSNIGWLGGNAYTGNYGDSVTCGGAAQPPAPTASACDNNAEQLGAIIQASWKLDSTISGIQSQTQRAKLKGKLDEFRKILACRA